MIKRKCAVISEKLCSDKNFIVLARKIANYTKSEFQGPQPPSILYFDTRTEQNVYINKKTFRLINSRTNVRQRLRVSFRIFF